MRRTPSLSYEWTFVLLLFIWQTPAGAVPVWSCKGDDCQEDRMKQAPPVQQMNEKKAEGPSKQKRADVRPVSHTTLIRSTKGKLARSENIATSLGSVPERGNLPPPHLGRNLDGYHLDGKPTLVATQEIIEKYTGIHVGDIAHVLLEQAITASPSVPSPIRVELLDGAAKGSFLIGEATLESDLKRVILQFRQLRDTSGAIYQIHASGLSPSGEAGLVGDYHSQDGKFFIAELLTAGIAGFADATINRSQSDLGNYVEQPGLDTAAKKGVVASLGRTSERMSDRAKSAPGYTKTQGYQVIPIIVTEEPSRKHG